MNICDQKLALNPGKNCQKDGASQKACCLFARHVTDPANHNMIYHAYGQCIRVTGNMT